ncbi:MAG: hypothetical protein IKJ59_06160 [Clostridia bacterium]|nr:hypothetical protein [Clostridia bacterium]
MITLKIAAHQIVTIDFPCSDNVLQEKLKEAGLGEMIPASAMVVDVLDPKDLPLRTDFFHNLDEINYLAKRMDSFTPRELDTFIEAVKHEESDMPKDMINTTFNLQAYSLFQDLSSMENVGKQYLLSKQGCITQDELENMNFVALGKEVLNTGSITVSDRGLLCKIDGAVITEIYDGTTFPSYDYTGDSLITVELSYKEKTEYLYLPDDDLSISKAIARLGADSLDACYCYISDISTDVGGTKDMLNRLLISEDLFAVNTVSSYINIYGMDLKKLQALIEYANVSDSTSICVLADRMDSFTFIEDITTDEEVGKYFVDNDEDYSVSAELEDYIKYDELGEHLREEMEGMFSKHGYVSMNNACETVEEIIETYSSKIQNTGMGGI